MEKHKNKKTHYKNNSFLIGNKNNKIKNHDTEVHLGNFNLQRNNSQLMENILSVDYFSQMLGVYVEVDILMCLLRDLYTPNMLKKLEKNDKIIYLQNILLQWFISLFIIKFPKKLQLFIWDILFIEKKIVLYKVSISLLHKYKYEIASSESIESLNKFLDDTFSKFNDVTFLKYILLIKNFEFDDEFLNLNRRNFMETKKKMWEKDNIRKDEIILVNNYGIAFRYKFNRIKEKEKMILINEEILFDEEEEY